MRIPFLSAGQHLGDHPSFAIAIQKYQNHLLKISSQSPIDIISNTTTTPIIIPPLAYMDDTTWHCEDPKIMQNILNDTTLLYKLNNIEVNPTKSDLLHIKSKNSKTQLPIFTFNNLIITPRKPEDIIRYLGIFYDGNGSSKPTLDKFSTKLKIFLY